MGKSPGLEVNYVSKVRATVARGEADAQMCMRQVETAEAKGVPMSAPGADPLAAIRQRAEDQFHDLGEALGDVRELLKQWDTRESALRALVAQLDEYDRIDQCSPATPWCDAPSYMNSDHYDGHPEPKRQRIKAIRDAVERLLSGPQP